MIRVRLPDSPPTGRAAGGRVRGGILLVVDRREDLQALIGLHRLVAASAWPRMAFVEGAADSAAEPRLAAFYGHALAGRWPDAASDGESALPAGGADQPDVSDSFDALGRALQAAMAFWGDEEQLVLRLAVAWPSNGPDREVTIELQQAEAALWMMPGSVIAGIAVGTVLKAARWCGLLTRPFTSTSAEAASRSLIERLRDLAGARSVHPAPPRLDALGAAESAQLAGRPILIVLLHGLCGTDVGTFDGFISRLKRNSLAALEASVERLLASAEQGKLVRELSGIEALRQDLLLLKQAAGELAWDASDFEVDAFIRRKVAIVGWPYDSLAPIDACASMLMGLLEREFGRSGPEHIFFVAHSQGGLLARAACTKLAAANSPDARWLERIAGIASFGAPHEGAAIAEPGFKGGRELALYLMMLQGTGQPTSIGSVLTILGERSLSGLEDLRPFGAGTNERPHSFVHELFDKESALRWPNGKKRPSLLAVGGYLSAERKAVWAKRTAAAFISHKLQHERHDLVVETSSSATRLLDPDMSLAIASDHFEYFEDGDAPALGIDVAIACIWKLLGPELAAWEQELEAAKKPMEPLRIQPRHRFPPRTD